MLPHPLSSSLSVLSLSSTLTQPSLCLHNISPNSSGSDGISSFVKRLVPLSHEKESPFDVIAKFVNGNDKRWYSEGDMVVDDIARFGRVLMRKWNALPRPIQICLAINAAFFVGWQLRPRFMKKHATISKENTREGRWYTILTSSFSHENPIHLYFNMQGLVTIGTAIVDQLGGKVFGGIVLFSSVVSSLADIFMKQFSLLFGPRSERELAMSRSSLGFSGINFGLFTIYALLFPDRSFLVPLQFQALVESETISASSLLKLSAMGDVIGLLFDLTIIPSALGHAAHLGGVLSGFLARLILLESNLLTTFSRYKLRNGIRFF